MDIADLRLLDTVAELGSFTAAASVLRLSQPAVSARVASVERTVGARLFARDTRGARLTPAGARYLGYVRRSLRLLDEGTRAAAADDSPPAIDVGVPPSYAPVLAPLISAALDASDRPLRLRSDHSEQLRTEVRDRRLMVALVTSGPVPAGLRTTRYTTTKVVALARPGRRIRRPERYALHDWGLTAETALTELLGQGIPRRSISVVSPAATATALALHHGHIAVVPALAAAEEISRGTLTYAELHLSQFTTHLDWLYRPEVAGTEPIDAILGRVRPAP